MKPRCISVSATLSARGEDGLTDRMGRHIESCFRCRGELSDHRTVTRGLEGLRSIEYVAPREVRPQVMAEIGPWVVPDPASNRSGHVRVAAAAAVATAATAAAGTAVLLRFYRQRAA